MAGETQKICAELAHMKKEDLLVEHFRLSSISGRPQRRENADQYVSVHLAFRISHRKSRWRTQVNGGVRVRSI